MTEFTGFAPSPLPTGPSPESARLLAKIAPNRTLLSHINPRGPSLRLYRILLNTIALAARPPTGGTAQWVRHDNGVRARVAAAADADPANGILLWLHGGGFVSGTPKLEQQLAVRYAAAARIPVFLPRYRLAPEHPFPAAADDVLAAYESLLRQGFAADRIRVAGMSAGCALVVGLLGDITRAGGPMPAAALLISPVLQLSAQRATERDATQPDASSSPDFLRRTNLAYAADTPLNHPRLDYLAAEMRDWPPTLVQVGGTECLVPDAEALGAAMTAAGRRCEVQVWPGQVHGFPGIGARNVPEAKAAADYGAHFLALS